MKQIEPAPDMPSKVVVPITEALKRFESTLKKFEELQIEVGTAIGEVIGCLQSREEAPFELAHDGYEMLPLDIAIKVADETLEGHEVKDINARLIHDQTIPLSSRESLSYIGAREQLGQDLLKLFDAYKLYRHGKLFYQILTLLDDALVLEKIGVPYLEDASQVRHAENITRQTGLAYRRRYQANVAQPETAYGVIHAPSLFAELRALTAPLDRSRRNN